MRQEELVQPSVIGQLGMKRCNEHRALLHQHRHTLVFGEHLYSSAGALHFRGADEHRMEWTFEADDHDVSLEAVDLAAISVATYGDVDHVEASLVRSPVDYLAS